MSVHVTQQLSTSVSPLPHTPALLDIFTRQSDSGRKSHAESQNSPVLANRDSLILEHMPMVRFIARRILEKLPQHVELDDLVAAGTFGLIDAASRFDQAKQIQFKSYAQFRVRGAIMDSLRTLDWSPRDLRRKGREIAEAVRRLSISLGRTPSDAEVAEHMELSLTVFQRLTGELKGLEVGSLDLDLNDGSGEVGWEMLPADQKENPLVCCIDGQNREQLAAAIEMLPERERLVLTLSYFEELTLKEVGLVLGVVESRASQLRSSAIARLRMLLKGVRKQDSRRVARNISY